MTTLSTVDARRTAITITFNGVDISDSMLKYLTSLTYNDYEEGESDEIQIALQDRNGVWVQQWIEDLIDSSAEGKMKIDVTITRKNWTASSGDFSLPCGTFELDSIVVDGPPTTVTIKGIALPFSSTIRQTLKSKAWEAISLSGIANEMASENGMTCLYESSNDPTYSRLEQYYLSDIAFLQQLCEDAGISLKATNNGLVLFDQATYEGVDTVLTLAYGGGGYTKYRLSSDDADTEYASCRVSYVDPTTGTVIEHTAYVEDYDDESDTNQHLEITAKVISIAEAESMATAQLRKYNKFAKTASITIPGNPAIVSGVTVLLTDWGAWDGTYMVYEVSHNVNGNGYVTKMSIRQVLEGY